VGFGEHQVRLGGLLRWIYGFWGISFIFGGDPFLVWGVFDVFWGLRWVFVGFSLFVNLKGSGLWVLEKIR